MCFHDLEQHAQADNFIIVVMITYFNDVTNNFMGKNVAYQFDYLFTKGYENEALFTPFFKKKKFQQVDL